METEGLLARLRAAEPQLLRVSTLQAQEALQPREMRMVPFRDQGRVEARSEEHIGHMRLALEAGQGVELEAVLVADVDGARLVVDGHHRLSAYRRAHRSIIPCRVQAMTMSQAVILSKLVNCSDRALEMHAEQRRDAAWQYLAAITNRGAMELPSGESLRTVAGLFGIGKDTVRSMLRQLPKVDPKGWSETAFDPGTGFPRWRYVREGKGGWHDMRAEIDMEQMTQHQAKKLAKKLATLMDKTTPEVVRRALQMLEIEAVMEAGSPDRQAFEFETSEATDF